MTTPISSVDATHHQVKRFAHCWSIRHCPVGTIEDHDRTARHPAPRCRRRLKTAPTVGLSSANSVRSAASNHRPDCRVRGRCAAHARRPRSDYRARVLCGSPRIFASRDRRIGSARARGAAETTEGRGAPTASRLYSPSPAISACSRPTSTNAPSTSSRSNETSRWRRSTASS